MFCSKKVNYWGKYGQRITQKLLYHNVFNICAAGICFSCSSAPFPGLLNPRKSVGNFQRLLNFTRFEIRAFQSILFEKMKGLSFVFTAHLQLKGVVRNGKGLQGNETNFIPKLRCEWRAISKCKMLRPRPEGKVKTTEIISGSSFFVCF